MAKPNIAVVLFPGNNCHEETLLCVKSAGMDGEIIRWNTKKDLSQFNGFILPGGFAYEDRIRSGVISAKDPIMEKIKVEAEKGSVVFGICNGAQALVESGMIPGIKDSVQMALAPNINPFVSGYFNTWVYIKSTGNSLFNKLYGNEAVPIPIAHGEGRFTTKQQGLIKELIDNDQISFRYCDKDGAIHDKFPINPNGSTYNIAGISNKRGNVLALMPHPERANWLRQVLPSKERNNKPGPGRKFFLAIKEYIEQEL